MAPRPPPPLLRGSLGKPLSCSLIYMADCIIYKVTIYEKNKEEERSALLSGVSSCE